MNNLMNKNFTKGAMILVVRLSLFTVDHTGFEKVTKYLMDNYNCFLSDCLEKPEYLKNALTELYNDSYDKIVNEIKTKLNDYNTRDDVAEFLQMLERN